MAGKNRNKQGNKQWGLTRPDIGHELFNLFVNYLELGASNTKFTGDTKLFRMVKTKADHAQSQEDHRYGDKVAIYEV